MSRPPESSAHASERAPPRRGIIIGSATVLGVGYLALLLGTARSIGYARDEGFYFQAARAYQRWFELLFSDRARALQRNVVDGAWSQNNEHPALIKSLFALSNLVLQKHHHLFDLEGTSFRFPAMVLAALLVSVLFAFVARRAGIGAGVVSALSLGFMPAFFHHAHLACFDVPIVAMFAFVALAYLKSLETKGFWWPLATGLLFGLALDTKHNAWFLPIAGVVHFASTALLARLAKTPIVPAVRRSLVTLIAMAIIGPLTLYALWPWIWHDTVARLHGYVSFHMNHDYYNMEFLGENYWKPPMPRSYAWIMTLATVPTVTLLLAISGIGLAVGRAYRAAIEHESALVPPAREDLFLALCLFVSYAAWLRSGTPIFGGTKHWMTAYPFMAIFGARAFVRVVEVMRDRVAAKLPDWGARYALPGAVTAAVLVAPVVETLSSVPFGLAAYVPLVGGDAGAATLGLNRSFWGYTTADVAPYLNRVAKKGARIYVHDTAYQSWQMLQEDGTIRADLVAVGSASEADFAIYHHELHMEGQEYQAWNVFDTDAPVDIEGPHGVPVVMVYSRHPQ